jgi:hypothetical protein
VTRDPASFIVAIALAVGVGVAVRPSAAGAVAVASISALAAVYRRQASVDKRGELEASDRTRLTDAEKKLETVQKELEPVKLDYERRKIGGR